jgi:hypothetical protein
VVFVARLGGEIMKINNKEAKIAKEKQENLRDLRLFVADFGFRFSSASLPRQRPCHRVISRLW